MKFSTSVFTSLLFTSTLMASETQVVAVKKATQPFSLSQAVNKAFKEHPQIQQVRAAEKVAEEDLAAALAGLYPTLDFRGSVGREHNQTQSIENEGDYYRTLTRNEFSLTMRQNLFDGFENISRIDKQDALLRRSVYNTDDNKQDVALRVVESYLEVLRVREQVAVARENVAAHEEIRKTVESRVKRNIARESDAVQVRGRLSLAKAQLRRELAAEQGIYARYREAVGQKPTDLAKPLDRSTTLPATLSAAKSNMRQSHPALQVSRQTIQATEASIKEAEARYYPRLDLEISGSEGDNINGDISNEDHYAAQLVLNYNVFRGGADKAAVASQRMRRVEQMSEKQALELALERDLAVSWHARDGLKVELKYFIEHMIATEKSLKAYSTQYEMGQRTLFDLLNARSEHFRAKSTVIDTRYSMMISVYQILVDMGVLMEDVFRKNSASPSKMEK